MLSTFLYSPINYSLLLGMPFIDSRLTTIPNCNASEQLIREIFLPTPFRSAFLNTERKTSLNTANQRIDNPFLFTSHRLGECFQIRSRVPVDWSKSLQHLYRLSYLGAVSNFPHSTWKTTERKNSYSSGTAFVRSCVPDDNWKIVIERSTAEKLAQATLSSLSLL